MGNYSDIKKALDRSASKKGIDYNSVWSDWLAWLCDGFEMKNVRKAGGLVERMAQMRDSNPGYWDAASQWMQLADSGIRTKGCIDVFGEIYESQYQTSAKASKIGQFFTPMDLCLLCSEIAVNKEATDKVVTHYDCACGSGRMLLANYAVCDKYNRNIFVAGDIDIVSVRMCALNFMISGMVGVVEQRNALTNQWSCAYIVNACKVPFANNMPSLEFFDDEKEYKRRYANLLSLAEVWNCVEYRPSEANMVEQEIVEEKQNVTQLTLF